MKETNPSKSLQLVLFLQNIYFIKKAKAPNVSNSTFEALNNALYYNCLWKNKLINVAKPIVSIIN